MEEKWFDRCVVETYATALPINWVTDLKRGGISPRDDLDIKKTEFERQAIRAAVQALNVVLVDLKFSPVVVSEQRFYFLDADVYQKLWPDNTCGTFSAGYVYIKRNPNPVILVATLAHELAHLVSYSVARIEHTAEDICLLINFYRVGFDFWPPKKNNLSYFSGFNEAITEMFALEISRVLVKNTILLNKSQGAVLTDDIFAYHSLVELVEKLISLVGDDSSDEWNLRRELFQNLITGQYTFLKKLEKRKRGAVKICRLMGITPNEALRSRKELHLTWAFFKKYLMSLF